MHTKVLNDLRKL